jgi:exo-1,4-beta-D-glucosaminidase
VIVTNSLLKKTSGLKVKADIYNNTGSLKYSHSINAEVEPDGIKKCFAIPEIGGLSDVYFLRLELNDEKGKTVSVNWYWLSKKHDELNWKKSKWYYTPQLAFADFSTLKKLPATSIRVSYASTKRESNTIHKISLTNTGKSVAFFVHLRILKGKGGNDILPVIFEDNYLLLAPGESRSIECSYENKDAANAIPFVLVSAWNLDIDHSSAGANMGFTKEME